MKLTLKQIRETGGPLGLLLQASGLPAKKAYWLEKIGEVFDAEGPKIEKRRLEMIKAHFPETEKGAAEIPTERVQEFESEFADFLSTEIDVPTLSLTFEEIEKVSIIAQRQIIPNPLSARDIGLLDWLITPPAEERAEEAAKAAGA